MRRRQEGAGGSGTASRKRRTHRPPRPRASPPVDLNMWGLLLALAAFAPAVGQVLGAPGTSVLGLAPPATTKAQISTPAPRSSPAQPPAGKHNGELQPQGPPLSQVACPTHRTLVMTGPQHARARTHTRRRAHAHAHSHTRAHTLFPPGAMDADSAAQFPARPSQQSWDRSQWDAASFSSKPSLFTDEETETNQSQEEERNRCRQRH